MKSKLEDIVVQPVFQPKRLIIEIENTVDQAVIGELWNYHQQISSLISGGSSGALRNAGVSNGSRYDVVDRALLNLFKDVYEKNYYNGFYK